MKNLLMCHNQILHREIRKSWNSKQDEKMD